MKLMLIILLSYLFVVPPVWARELKVLSWNVFMLPKPIKNSLQGTRKKIIAEQLNNTTHDLIFMQEAFIKDFRNKVRASLLKTHPYSYYLKKPKILISIFGSGLFVVSRYPVKLVDHVYYRNCASADCLATKGAVLMEITLPGGQRVHVVNTHLQAINSQGEVRMKQLAQIHAMLLRHGRPDVPQFLIGDLNIDDDEPEFRMSLSLLGMDYANLTGPILYTGGISNPCFKSSSSKKWIDHIWYSNYHGIMASEMRVKPYLFDHRGQTCPLSDHHAVEATFSFSGVM
jgi:endonuclease/exonuclease/phosphatase family metal-dependent hydrolase